MTIVVNNWRLDPSRNALIHVETGEIRRLGEYHFALLITFISHSNNVLSRQYLMSEVWKNRVVGSNSLPTAIHALRVALDDNGKQQEIIKTVPKKGYVLNKEFVSGWTGNAADAALSDEDPVPEALSSELAMKSAEESAAGEPLNEPAMTTTATPMETAIPTDTAAPGDVATPLPTDTPALRETPSQSRRGRRHLWLVAGALALTGVTLAAYYGLRHPPASPPSVTAPQQSVMQLKNESYPAVDRIMIMHVVNSSVSESTTPSLQTHLGPALEKINQLLEKHQTTATIFYHVIPTQFSMSVLVNNQCDVTWQIVSSMKNWQGHDDEMGERLLSSVERTVNDMPACEK
ncbi:winged helix-turn-helix domain-containing protein [Siccibacter turicensis]|uniref:transcriptional regulator n=1 Tax=Siccibacter turicensis TaxID=357233 RepID=UPI003F54CFD0